MSEQIDAVGGMGAVALTDDPVASRESTPVAPPAALTAPRPLPSPEAVRAAVEQINTHLASVNRVLELTVDAATKLTVAVIKDSRTGELLQQFPNQDSVDLAQMLASWSHGGNVLLDLIT